MTKIVEENDMQGAFNAAYNGLKAQNWMQSRYGAACSYRGPAGRKCAIGHMIPDEQYSKDIEGYGCYNTDVQNACGWVAPTISVRFYRLLSALQAAHDCNNTGEDMKRAFCNIASDCNLQVPE